MTTVSTSKTQALPPKWKHIPFALLAHKKGPVLPEDAILQELFYGIKIIPGKKRRKPPKKQDNMKWPKATHALQEPLASCTWNA